MRTLLAILFTVLGAGLLSAPAAAQRGYPKLAPFDGVRWEDDLTLVRIEGTWHELMAIDGLRVSDVLAFCEERWPGQARERFGEDLVEALSRMGQPPGRTVSLILAAIDTGDVRTLEDVPLTAENRSALLRANRGAGPSAVTVELRPLPEQPDPRYAHLTRLVAGRLSPALDAELARRDLAVLERALDDGYSYRDLAGVDVEAAFDALHLGVARQGDTLQRGTFALGLRKLLALFGDGHLGVGGLRGLARPGYADYLLGDTGEGLVAFEEDRSGLVDEEHPYLVAIDGLPVERWIEAAETLDALGSPQLRRFRAVRNLRYVAQLRAELGRVASRHVDLSLAGEDGLVVTRRRALRADSAPVYGSWPRSAHQRLAGGRLGYLRLDSMSSDDDFLFGIDVAMGRFEGTAGLVVDVRGNSGGSRHALRTLLPYLLGRDEGPRVVSVAAFRLPPGATPGRAEGYLSDRFLFPASAAWPADEQAAIDAFAPTFEPDWDPGLGFSAWHYMVVGHATYSDAYPYEQPVVVLCDSGCYSATDVFLGALAELPQVTLMGTPSGGGSARTQRFELPGSGLTVRIATMASFRPSGARYDGRGVEVDRLVHPEPGDFLGRGDAQLDAAFTLLLER